MLTKLLHLSILLIKLAASSPNNDLVFNGFSGSETNFTLSGLAEFTSTGLLQLTNNTKVAAARAFYSLPLPFNAKPTSFSTTFAFAIVPKYLDSSGHGMTFAISPDKYLSDSMDSPFLGLFNNSNNGKSTNHIVAVELDTAKNPGFHDIDNNHVGIDINGVISVNATPAAYLDSKGNSMIRRLVSGDPMQVWIDYSGADLKLEVKLAPLGAPRPSQSLVSSRINMSSILLDEMFVGFTASTGETMESHYVLGWSFSLDGDARALDLSKLPSVPRAKITKSQPRVAIVALPLAAVILLLVSVAGLILIERRRRAKKRRRFAELLDDWEVEYGPHRFMYRDLFNATGGFNEQHLLGVGGFGRVYKGVLSTSKTEIAVKKISNESRQGMKEFVAEIASMGRLRHRNLVHLLGYCRRQGELLLVYDFMANGSLDKFLFRGKDKAALSWIQRFQIIKGVASGLLYLHEGWEQVVIHRDIKAANVLLDEEMNAKLGDFGLARLYDRGSNPQTTHIVGTLGYLAPELSRTGKATIQTDVFAFGVFLLEVACGRRPMEMHGSGAYLVDFVLDCMKRGAIIEAADPKLGGDCSVEEIELVLRLGLLCSHPDPAVRPVMRKVMQLLEGEDDLPVVSFEYSSASVNGYDGAFDGFIMSFPSFSSTGPAATTSSSQVSCAN